MALPRYPTYRIPDSEYDEESQPLFFNPPEDPNQLPIKPIPGSYGLPFIGAILDRWDFYYNQGRDGFFQARLEKYKSTVFRANAPPGPFIAKDPKVIVVLDALAFPVLFDMAKVEKRDIFDGTYMPSVNFTGGYRVLSFLDPSEPKHKALKSFCFSLLASKKDNVIPVFRKTLGELFSNLETQLKGSESVEFNKFSDPKAFEYVFQLFCGKNPAEAGLGETASKTVDLWLVPQIIPLVTLGLPGKLLQTVEDLLVHTFPIPPFLVKGKYAAIVKAYNDAAGKILDGASQFGLERDEALHNLIFITCFNTYGGLKVLFAGIFKWLGRAGVMWHKNIAKEVRAAVKQDPNGGGGVTLASLDRMALVKSTVHEVLRIDPPVPFQYGKAKEDLILESHDARYEVKKGEMIFGYQPFATKDPKVFEKAEEFVPYRFMGKSEANLKYVYWANGRETEAPTTENKQCPGRDFVVLVARVLVAEFFLRYDTFTSTDKAFLVGSKVNFTSLTKATTAFTADLE